LSVIAFKLLDLTKVHDDFEKKCPTGRRGHIPQSTRRNSSKDRPPAPVQQQRAHTAPVAPARSVPTQQKKVQQKPPQGNLMDFGSSAGARGGNALHHANSAPSLHRHPVNPNETNAEKLKREYKAKAQTANRIWDPIDERWVEIDPKVANSAAPTSENTKKEIGISLDATSAVGKSATVQAAVHKRVNDMKESQAKALQEVRGREAKKKRDEAEEDDVRRRLEPKIKAWSEEHGKKKQLRALVATMQNILWPAAAATWKPMSIGDLLDDKKVKLAFHKASRVVHPDKTHHLSAEERFLAKRMFDALSQAKAEFDEQAK
jgi:hypothetical protein